ncbi:hypothetical protein HPB50_008721 [Hyalomma asiaticum]|uniref:Uncharacterized protein n=1 Tax=Hyalomma asiaticum TaxID=266040 RepID=A0ACB7TD74_HYAAI|nr:hypothetical protein HPB50_008721 [Hyalomma asiaticum]
MANSLVLPYQVARQVKSQFIKFFWDAKTPLVKYERLSLPRQKGGWNIPSPVVLADIYAMKTTLRVLQLQEDHPARKLATYVLGVQSRLFFPSFPSGPKALSSKLQFSLGSANTQLVTRYRPRHALVLRVGRPARSDVQVALCPNECVNCREHESNEHALLKCRSAVTFWSLPSAQLLLRSLLVCTLPRVCIGCYLGRCFLSSLAAPPPGLPPAAIAAARNSAAVATPSRLLLLPDTNPFAPLRELEAQNNIEGKSENASNQARIISTAPYGEKRARGSLLPTPERHSGSPRKYQLTVILRPKQPCRIMDEQFIRLDRVITRHISAHLNLSDNQLAVNAAEPEVRNTLLAIASLPVSGKDVPFQAYEAVSQNQIRGIIRNAGDMTSEELMNSLHWRMCKILQARPLGDKGTAMVTFEGNSLPYKVGLRSFTIRVFPHRVRVAVCDICHKIRYHKEQCPNTLAARCPTCGLRQHEEGTQCPNAEPKCRSCGGSHLATATNCPKRKQVNKKIEQKRKPAAKRQRKKRQAQGHQHHNAETEQGFSRPVIKPTRQSFYTGPPAPSAAQSEDSNRITFADIVKQANAHLTHGCSNGVPHPSCSTLASSAPQPASGGGAKHPRRDAAQSTGLAPVNDHQHLPAPTLLQDLERRLENPLTLSVVGCRLEVSSQRTILVFCIYVVPENTRNKANKASVDLSFVSHFKKLCPQDTVPLCGDFNSQHVAWGYKKCSPRGRRIMQDALEYGLTLLNAPQTH